MGTKTRARAASLPQPPPVPDLRRLEDDPTVAAEPVVRAALRLAETLLEPDARSVEREGVPVATLDALAANGLYGIRPPAELGGAGASARAARTISEILAGACGSTWFVWIQHQLALSVLLDFSAGETVQRLVRKAAGGSLRCGIALSHVHQRPDALGARPADGGRWSVSGTVAWASGWGLIDALLVAARCSDGRLLLGLVPARPSAAARPSARLDVVALTGANTVRVELEDAVVEPDRIVAVTEFDPWVERNRNLLVNVNPGVLGLTRRVLAELLELTETDRSLSSTLRPRIRGLVSRFIAVRERCYWLIDECPPERRIKERARMRASAQDLSLRCCALLVAAAGGRAVVAGHDAERWARQALLQVVQAQTDVVRDAFVRRLT